MKKIELPINLLSFMLEKEKYVFVDDFAGWGKETKLDGFEYFAESEGCGLIALEPASESEKEFMLQSTSIRRGNHLTVQFRWRNVDAPTEVHLSDFSLFKEFPVVISTTSEALTGFAPMCSTLLELALFIEELNSYTPPADREGLWERRKRDMVKLAKFLYWNNPNKKPSAADDLF